MKQDLFDNPGAGSRKHGFALVIALSLMVFTLLLLLAIVSLVKVETHSVEISTERIKAGQNALLGAYIALGELQMAAGPDQRVTASGQLHPGTHETKHKYTTVWDAAAPVLPGALAAPTPIAWLASGADHASFDPAATTENRWFELVPSLRHPAVRAYPVEIKSRDIVAAKGSFSWWVGDEGVKAKVNLVEDETLIDRAANEEHLRVTARNGIEALDGIDGAIYPYHENDGDLFRKDLRKSFTTGQLSTLDSRLGSAVKNRYHDLTLQSRSLLTDTRNGGLKQDLTYLLSNGSGNKQTGSIFTGTRYEKVVPPAYNRITWEQLRSYYELSNEIHAETIEARPQTATQYGVAPVLAMLHLNFGITVKPSSLNTPEDSAQQPAERSYTLHHHIRPWFVLANPYNLRLQAKELKIRMQSTPFSIVLEDMSNAASPTVLSRYEIGREFQKMVFVVPKVDLEPGQAKIFSLDYDRLSHAIDSDFYVRYQSGAAEQLFFFEDEFFDEGIATIRIEPAASVLTGDQLEEVRNLTNGGPGLATKIIKPLGWKAEKKCHFMVSSYLNDRIAQHIGPITFWLHKPHEGRYSGYFGYWPLAPPAFSNRGPTLPDVTSAFQYKRRSRDRRKKAQEPDSFGEADNTRCGAASMVVILCGAVGDNADTPSYFTNNAGLLADTNFRSPRVRILGKNDAGNYRGSWVHNGSSAFTAWTIGNGNQGNTSGPDFPWGAGYRSDNRGPKGDPRRAVLFDLPRLDSLVEQPALASLGQLQHFNVGGYADGIKADANPDSESDSDPSGPMPQTAYAPAYAISNSYASPYLKRTEWRRENVGKQFEMLDLSYVLNDILFDRYYFSSIPQSGPVDFTILPNRRLKPLHPKAGKPDELYRTNSHAPAEHCHIEGGFNVNSTSVDAWYAFLNSFRNQDFGGKFDGQGFFPRSLYQNPIFAEEDVREDRKARAIWSGWRHMQGLEPTDPLRRLAEAIVEEVKLRGPFLSMTDFLNRDLTAEHTGLSGPLQAAIDRTLNTDFDNSYDVNPDMADKHPYVDKDNLGSGAILKKDGSTAPASGAVGLPGWVMQGDLLQSLAPAMTVRSDTFTIRSRGTSTSGIDGTTSAQTCVEMIVQRMPEYVDPANPPETPASDLNPQNQLMGRRFNIFSIKFVDDFTL